MTNIDWFKGRTAIVTGASSGMGSAIALALGRAGANVGINYNRNQAAAEAIKEEIDSAGGSGLVLQANVGDPEHVERMFTTVDETFGGKLDMIVCNAGEWMEKNPVVECPLSEWDQMIRVNATSVFLCCQQAARRMIPQGEGAIVTVGSVAGHTGGGGGTVPYAAAKSAVHTFTRGLARELAPHGIRVNGFAPGVVDTPMQEGRATPEVAALLNKLTPVGRMGQADEVVDLALLLLSPGSSFMAGEIVEINGGLLMR
ncbi:MAG TPA: oxidoreductase [Lentisphaeria bacterium]|nr:oxidoreductase [Lentisphaeria bacterium]